MSAVPPRSRPNPPQTGRGAPITALLALLLAACGPQPQVTGQTDATAPPGAPASEAVHQHVRYVCPMHPQIVRDAPGTCPICGMTLVPKQIEEPAATGGAMDSKAASAATAVALSPAVIQTLGVRTAPVERQTLWRHIRTVGRVAYDETRLVHVHPRAEGWIESLKVRSEGAPVQQGQELADLYAPRILNAQVDFLLALDQPRGATQIQTDKARNLLRLLDVPDDVIRDLERTRTPRNTVPVRAPLTGVVTGLMAREGMYVTEATEMFTIADLSRVWVLVDVFEDQMDRITPGLTAQIRIPAYPGRTWEGQVDYVYPELDPKTRTLKVRLVFPNPDGALKPNLFADVQIQGGPRPNVLTIPTEALIATGSGERVVKALEGGRFAPVEVATGLREPDRVEVRSGLAEGDRVVVSGQFLIDSESNLKASLRRMGEDEAAATPVHRH